MEELLDRMIEEHKNCTGRKPGKIIVSPHVWGELLQWVSRTDSTGWYYKNIPIEVDPTIAAGTFLIEEAEEPSKKEKLIEILLYIDTY